MISRLLEFLSEFFYSQYLGYTKWQADKFLGVARSPLWEQTKREFAKLYPKVCSVLGCTRKDIELHHIIPFHKDQSKENDLTNVMWFCRFHHYWFGHLGKWASWLANVREFVKNFNELIANRP